MLSGELYMDHYTCSSYTRGIWVFLWESPWKIAAEFSFLAHFMSVIVLVFIHSVALVHLDKFRSFFEKFRF